MRRVRRQAERCAGGEEESESKRNGRWVISVLDPFLVIVGVGVGVGAGCIRRRDLCECTVGDTGFGVDRRETG